MSDKAEDKPDDKPVDGRQVSDKDGVEPPRPREAGTVQLTDLSVRAIALYQKQSELTDRLWSYFGTCSALSVLAALVAPVLAQGGLLPTRSYMIFLFSLAVMAYYVFSIGNREALRVSQDALGRIAAQAMVASGIPLDVVKTPRATVFHKTVTLIVLLTMATGFWIASSTGARVGDGPQASVPAAAAPNR